jgi:hypothetical protein
LLSRKFELRICFISLLSFIFFQNCEEIPSEIVDQEKIEFRIESVSAPEIVIYSDNNTASASITIDNAETVSAVWFDITTVNGNEDIASNIEMIPESEGKRRIYVGEYQFDEDLLPGNYEFAFFVEDAVNTEGENIRKAATKKFKFILEEENSAPEISDPVIPEVTPQGSRVLISVKVVDSNGPEDVQSVYFRLHDPNNVPVYFDQANSILEFPLNDDGANGDFRRDDGIYSSYYTFSADAELGKWKFMLEAEDQSGELSNSISNETQITENFAPEISELIIPNEVDRGVEFIFSLTVSDQNGLSDINFVYFELRRPDGTLVYVDEDNTISTFPMFDNGDLDGAGDETEGDGIYSLKNSFGSTAQTGDWTFTFNASDNAGTVSNTITHILKVN